MKRVSPNMSKPMIAQLHPPTLSFRDSGVERAFAGHLLPRLRVQGGAAILVGTAHLSDFRVSRQLAGAAGTSRHGVDVRLSALTYAGPVFLLTFRPAFERFNWLPLGSQAWSSPPGLIGILYYLPLEEAPYFYPGLILSTFYTYSFIGARFIYALVIVSSR